MSRPTMFAVFALVVSLAAPVSAQVATPGPLPTIPAADECRVEPMTVDAVVASWPAGTPVPPREVASEHDLPKGVPAAASIVSDVTALERAYVACYNAAQWLQVAALFTDHALRAFDGNFADEGELRAFLATTGTPEPVAGGTMPIVLLAVRDVRVLPDGRVGAVVEWGRPAHPGVIDEINFHLYRHTDHGWRLDDEIAGFVPWSERTDATPPAWQTP